VSLTTIDYLPLFSSGCSGKHCREHSLTPMQRRVMAYYAYTIPRPEDFIRWDGSVS
jgi:hypothetical protein